MAGADRAPTASAWPPPATVEDAPVSRELRPPRRPRERSSTMVAHPPPAPARAWPAAAPLFALALAFVSHAGCDGAKTRDAAAGPRTDDAMLAAWRKAGLEVSAFTDVDTKPFQATSCRGGTAGGVDVVLCSYDTGEDAHAAQDLGLTSVGAATGASIARGSRLIVVADRRKADPSGRTIDALLRAFQ